MTLSKSDFDKFAQQGFNRIPLMREVLADLDTPLSTYIKLAGEPYSYLFESVQGGEKWGRYSIIGLPARTYIKVTGQLVEVISDGVVAESDSYDDPLAFVREYKSRFRVPEIEGLPRFTGGLVGYFGYETVRYIEPRLGQQSKPDEIGAPDILLMVSEEVVVFDTFAGKLYVVVHADPDQVDGYDVALQRLQELISRLRGSATLKLENSAARQIKESDFTSGFEQSQYEAAVEKSREYIQNGDIMQVVLSQRMSVPFTAKPINMYRALRTLNPSPYMYYINLDDFFIVGSSPEILARMEDGQITSRPIAGTRKRGADEKQDKLLEQELLSDDKECAEHLMLIDLARNDVGRVSKIGSVKVTDKMFIERYSHVMHISSNVIGVLEDNKDAIDVLRATFPAGTLSGAPKVRAMEIIDELEPVKRGIYSGAIGYIGWNGNIDTAIAIRTAIIKDDTLYIQAGAGIVADSNPNFEWKETMKKARAIIQAAAMAEAGIDGNGNSGN